MVMAKHKGNAFENRIFRDLDSLNLPVRKTLGSGSPEDQCGDLLLWASNAQFAIECKHYRELTWKMLCGFFDKLKEEINTAKHNSTPPLPMMIFRENRKPIMVMTVATVNGKTMRCIVSYNLWKQTLKV